METDNTFVLEVRKELQDIEAKLAEMAQSIGRLRRATVACYSEIEVIPKEPRCAGEAILWVPGRKKDRERFYQDEYDLL
jgi:hypothetical protein